MIAFTKETLREALNGLRVLKLTKHVKPACQRVLVIGHESLVQFDGTDLDQYLRYEGSGSGIAPTRVLVPFEVLANAGKQADGTGEIRLFGGDEPCIIYPVAGSLITVPFAPLDLGEFPPKPFPTGEPIALPAGVVGSLAKALGCSSTDESRYLLNSVYLDAHAVAATDGRQLYRRNSLDLPLAEGAIFPASSVPGILPDAAAELVIWTENSRRLAQISVGRWRWITKLVEGNYPRFSQVIPKLDDYGSTVRLAEEDVARIRTVVPKLPGFKDRDSLIVLSIAADKTPILRTAPQYPKVHVALERSSVTCPAPMEVAFNARYLLGALATGLRELRLRDPFSPLVLNGESKLQLWMPCQLKAPQPVAASAPAVETPAPTAGESAASTAVSVPSSDPAGESPAQVVSVEVVSSGTPSAPIPTNEVNVTHTVTHNPPTTMVAPANTHSQPANEIRDDSASGAVAPRIPAASAAQPLTVVDAVNARLSRLRDLLREAATEFANIQTLVKEQQRSHRILERDHEALKKNIRALREVPV